MTPAKTATDKAQIYLDTFCLSQPWFDSKTPKAAPRASGVKNKTKQRSVCIFWWTKALQASLRRPTSYISIILMGKWFRADFGSTFITKNIKEQHWSWKPGILSGVSEISVLLQKPCLSARWSKLLVPLDLLCPFICPAGGRRSQSQHRFTQS